jgi:type IV secretion system protein VirD4
MPTHPTLFLIDEAAALGYLRPVEMAAGYIAAYARMVLVFQDCDQLRRTYPKADSIMANAGCHVAFGINDFGTAELLSRTIGMTTVRSRSQGHSHAWNQVIEHQRSSGVSEASRWLLNPAEILGLPRDQLLIFMRDQVRAPIRAHKLDYRHHRLFAGQFDAWRTHTRLVPMTGDGDAADHAAADGRSTYLEGAVEKHASARVDAGACSGAAAHKRSQPAPLRSVA